MQPRVIILSCFLTPFRSGAEACAEEVAVRLGDRYDVTIVTARLRRDLPREEMLRGKVTVKRVGFGVGFDKWFFPFLAPFVVRKLQPALIHAILETYAGLALDFCTFICPSAKRLLTLQTTNRSFLKWYVLRSPHALTAISTHLIGVAQRLGRGDVTHIPNGIDVVNIETRTLPAGRQVSKREKTPGRIIFVGRLRQMKGVDTLLHSFAIVTTHYQLPTPHLQIVGDGELRPKLERLTHDLGLEGRVTFTGYIPTPDVYDEFAQAEIFCSLSRHEALGNVFIEAQAAGCAILGTTIEGIPDVVTDGVNGLLVAPDDVEAASKAMQKLLTDSDLRRKLSKAGIENARQYNWDIIAERYAQVYDHLL